MEEIINRVAKSKLVTFDLEDLYPNGERKVLDISQWLVEGVVLREKSFRESVKEHDWQQYQDCYVALTCSTDAILPGWAFLLVTTHLNPYARQVVVGPPETLETVLYTQVISGIDAEKYRDQLVIIKGCAKKPVPENAYVLIAQKLQPVVKNLMFGEACSSVPLYKRK